MKHAIMLTFFMILSLALMADIYSTPSGGFWSLQTTWVGGSVPGAADNVIIQGPVILDGWIACHNLTVLASGSLITDYYNTYSMTVNGNLNNAGDILNNWHYLILDAKGDVVNTGNMSMRSLYLSGTANQNLSNTGILSPYDLIDTVASSSLTLLTDISLAGVLVDLGNSYVVLNGTVLCDLSLSGGYLKNAAIHGGNGASITLGGDCYLDNVSMDEIIFNGVGIIDFGVSVGTLYNYATLYNHHYHSVTLSVTQRLENYGIIQNNPSQNYLSLSLGGDLYNYGTISNQNLSLAKTSLCNLFQAIYAPPISCPTINSSTGSGNYQLLSDLRFTNSSLNMYNKTLFMNQGGASYDLSISGGYLTYAVLDGGGTSTLTMGESAYLDNVSSDELIFNGVIIIDFNVSIGTLYNYATLYNHHYHSVTLSVTQRLENYGIIQNNPTQNYLYLTLGGDLYNYGTIQIHQVLVSGIADQHIIIDPGSVISCTAGFTLVSDVGPAQWYFNGLVNNSNYYSSLDVSPTVLGVWQPFNGTIFGRYIIIGNGSAISQPQNLLISRNGLNLHLQWDIVSNALYYNVYSAADPYGAFTFLAKAFDADLTDTIVWWESMLTESRRFYKVTAGN